MSDSPAAGDIVPRRPHIWLAWTLGLLGGLALAVLAALAVWALGFGVYRIPSDAMIPTLYPGDTILVSKLAYTFGRPQPGDLAVVRSPAGNLLVKRIAGLPGDQVAVRHDELEINGKAVPFQVTGIYDDGCYVQLQRATEHLGAVTHEALRCPVPLAVNSPAPGCPRPGSRAYLCSADPEAALELAPLETNTQLPAGEYFVIGDNRDNSEDSRVWGPLSADRLAGKVVKVWAGAGHPVPEAL